MAEDIDLVDGQEVQGSGHFKNLRGRVIDKKETGFGMKYALVKPINGGDPEWARTVYLTPIVKKLFPAVG